MTTTRMICRMCAKKKKKRKEKGGEMGFGWKAWTKLVQFWPAVGESLPQVGLEGACLRDANRFCSDVIDQAKIPPGAHSLQISVGSKG
jgi:hypothetical protein